MKPRSTWVQITETNKRSMIESNQTWVLPVIFLSKQAQVMSINSFTPVQIIPLVTYLLLLVYVPIFFSS